MLRKSINNTGVILKNVSCDKAEISTYVYIITRIPSQILLYVTDFINYLSFNTRGQFNDYG